MTETIQANTEYPVTDQQPIQSDEQSDADIINTTSVALIGSQQQTYDTLIAMGFEESDSLIAAQVYGSSVAGAIDCITSGNVNNINPQQPPTPQPSRESIPQPYPPKPTDVDADAKPFRITSTAQLFVSAYIREIDGVNDYIFSPDVLHLILTYMNMYFIRINLNIRNGKCMSMFAVRKDMSLRDVAIQIETDTFNQKYRPTDDHVEARRVHFWLPFNKLKCIYPVDNRKIKISMQQIEEYQCEKDNDRWVELPNDYEDVSIHDFDQMMMRNGMNDEFALGVEVYDEINEKWPFRNDKFKQVQLPNVDNQVTQPKLPNINLPNVILEDGEYQIISSHSNKALDVQWGRKHSGAKFIQWTPMDVANQTFILKRQACGNYTVRCKHSNLYWGEKKNNCNNQSQLTQLRAVLPFGFESIGSDANGRHKYLISVALLNGKVLNADGDRINFVPNRVNNYTAKQLFYCRPVGVVMPTNMIFPVKPKGNELLKYGKCQQELLNYGNNLLSNLDVKYAPHLTDDINDLWERKVLEAALFYEGQVEDMALLKEKMAELKDTWNGVVKFLEEDYNEANVEREAKLKAQQDWTNHLEIGDIVDAADEQEKWYESVIRWIEMKDGRKLLYLHYIGWNKKWDEPIFADDFKRIAMRNTKTEGPHRNRRLKKLLQYHVYQKTAHTARYPLCYSDHWKTE